MPIFHREKITDPALRADRGGQRRRVRGLEVLPGTGLASLLLMEGKALAGFDSDKHAAIQGVATRHMEVEKYQSAWLRRLLNAGEPHPMIAAYARLAEDADYPPYSVDYLREVVSAQAVAESAAFDEAIEQWLATAPATTDFSASNQVSREDYDHPLLNQQLFQLLGHFGAHSRIYVGAGLAPAVTGNAAR